MQTDNKFIVYKHECSLCKSTNGIYIGITCRDPEERWQTNGNGYLAMRTTADGERVYQQPKIAHAILAHTWEAFSHEILLEDITFEEAKQKEIEYIDYFDSFEHGLNSTRGGEGFLKYNTEEAKAEAIKISQQKYLEAHREDRRNYSCTYYYSNRDECIQKSKQRYKENCEQLKAQHTEYRKNRRVSDPEWHEQEKAKQRERYATGGGREYNAKYRAEHAEQINARAKEIRERLRSLRLTLLKLTAEYPGIVGESDLVKISKPNTCKSISYLTNLINLFKNAGIPVIIE